MFAPKYCASALYYYALPEGWCHHLAQGGNEQPQKGPGEHDFILTKGRNCKTTEYLCLSVKEKTDKVVSPCQSLGV